MHGQKSFCHDKTMYICFMFFIRRGLMFCLRPSLKCNIPYASRWKYPTNLVWCINVIGLKKKNPHQFLPYNEPFYFYVSYVYSWLFLWIVDNHDHEMQSHYRGRSIHWIYFLGFVPIVIIIIIAAPSVKRMNIMSLTIWLGRWDDKLSKGIILTGTFDILYVSVVQGSFYMNTITLSFEERPTSMKMQQNENE